MTAEACQKRTQCTWTYTRTHTHRPHTHTHTHTTHTEAASDHTHRNHTTHTQYTHTDTHTHTHTHTKRLPLQLSTVITCISSPQFHRRPFHMTSNTETFNIKAQRTAQKHNPRSLDEQPWLPSNGICWKRCISSRLALLWLRTGASLTGFCRAHILRLDGPLPPPIRPHPI